MVLPLKEGDHCHGRPQGRWTRVGARPPPPLEKKLWGPFCYVFSLWEGENFSPCGGLFANFFSTWGPWGSFLACPPLPTKISAGAYESINDCLTSKWLTDVAWLIVTTLHSPSDINECETDNGGCDSFIKATCTNIIGGRKCKCNDGYLGDTGLPGNCKGKIHPRLSWYWYLL